MQRYWNVPGTSLSGLALYYKPTICVWVRSCLPRKRVARVVDPVSGSHER